MKRIFTASNCYLPFLILTLSLFVSTNSLYAQKTWLGNTSDWHTASNWNPAGVPEAADDVSIPATSNNPEISANAVAGSVGVWVNAGLNLTSSGSLQIAGSNSTGLSNSGDIINEGNITIDDLDGSPAHAIFNSLNSTFSNKNTIIIGANANISHVGIVNRGYFLNDVGKTIRIDNAIEGISNSDEFINKGSIKIGEITPIGTMGEGVNNDSNFTNELGASISIDNIVGIGLSNAGFFINKGALTLGAFGSFFTGLSSSGTFTNENNAIISIDNTILSGCSNIGMFTNKGLMEIGLNHSIGGDGIRCGSGGNFINESGQIIINNSGIRNFDNGIITNKASITIDGGITNLSTGNSITNEACAEMIVYGPLYNSSIFNNNGFLFLNYTQSYSPGNITNNGLIIDIQGTFPTGGSLTNNQIIIAPSTGSCSGLTPAFALGNAIDFTIHGVYTDMNLNNSAGTYDVGNNIFTCNLDPGMHTLFVDIEDGNGGCSYVAEWKVTIESSLPPGWTADPNGIGCTNGNDVSFDNSTQTFTITSEGCYDPSYYSTSDSHGFVYTELCGDGEIIAEIQSVNGDGWAGVSVRESTDPGAKMLQLLIDGSFLTRRQMRTSTNGMAFNHQFQTQGKNWLRLTRSGNSFSAQHSLDGINWSTVLATNLSLPNCIPIGLVTMNNQASGALTAVFGNVEIKSNTTLVQPNTGDQAHLEVGFSIYPNPVSGKAWINLASFLDRDAQLSVYNQLGQKVLERSIKKVAVPTQELDFSLLHSGAYWVKIVVDGQQHSKRIIVE